MDGLRSYYIPDHDLESFIKTDLRNYFEDEMYTHSDTLGYSGVEFQSKTWLDAYKYASYADIRHRLDVCFGKDFPELSDYQECI